MNTAQKSQVSHGTVRWRFVLNLGLCTKQAKKKKILPFAMSVMAINTFV